MTTIDTSTEAIGRLLKDVTEGPWAVDLTSYCCDVVTEYGVPDEDFVICEHLSEEDARFVAAARDLVPALLKERDEALARAAAAFEMAVVHLRNWQDDLIATGYPDMGVAVGMAADVLADLATKAERDALAKIRAEAMREAADVCACIRTQIANGPMPEGARFDYEQSILARADQIEKGETK